MEQLFILSESCKSHIEIFGLIASIFAIGFSILYLFHPRFLINLYLSDHPKTNKKSGKRLNIKIKNGNKLPRSIVEIKCEVTAMHFNKEKVKTLILAKDEIIVLKHNNEHYTFYTIDKWGNDNKDVDGNNYEVIRIRLLALNFLGIKKHAEGFFKIADFNKGDDCIIKNIKHYRKMPCP